MSESLSRGTGRARLVPVLALLVVFVGIGTDGMAGPDFDLGGLPDLRPREAEHVAVESSDADPSIPALRFQTVVENRGTAPLEIVGLPSASDPNYPGWDPRTLDAYQCDSWAQRACLNYRPVGRLVFHETHAHWHVEGYIVHELRYLAADGKPDWASPPLVQSPNDSFCVMDNYFDEDLTGDPADRHLRMYPACSLVRHGISPGWVDVDIPELPGQEIPIAGVADGDYALVIRVDPGNRLAEADRANNVSWLPIRLSGSLVDAIGKGSG